MRKIIPIGLAVLVLLAIQVFFFLPGYFEVSRSVSINAPAPAVYPMLADLARWNEWDPWLAAAPNGTITLSETTVGVGATRSWSGEGMGTGTLRIIGLKDGERIDCALIMEEPVPESADMIFVVRSMTSGSEVSWRIRGTVEKFLDRLRIHKADEMLGPVLERGLKKLKENAENGGAGASTEETAAPPS
jgi:hypothetical protein